MLPDWKIEKVRRMLARKRWSYNEIAARAGVSKGTVSTVATGKRPDYSRQPKAPVLLDGEGAPLFDTSVPPSRCGNCGAMVYKLCLWCRTRAEMQLQRLQVEQRPRIDSRRVA